MDVLEFGDVKGSADLQNTLFVALELSRATWVVATYAPRDAGAAQRRIRC